ncbi:MAG: ABC transporter ATP-binding protein [Planctomycetes bacterium]|nr:ABC transporter ATP-binding protein [Planctomycetota bacterium]
MLGLAWQFRAACLRVLVLNLVLVALNLSGLGLAGLGIDVLRQAFQPDGPAPRWPLGWNPPVGWSPLALVVFVAAIVLIVAIFQATVKFVAAVAGAALSQEILIQLRTNVYDKLQRLSFHYFDSNESSAIINRMTGDVQAVRGFVDGVLLKILTVALSLGVYFAYMLSVHAPLACACLVTSPLLWVGAVLFSRTVRPLYKRSSELNDKLILRLSENVQGIQVVKGFAREDDEIARFTESNRALKDQKYTIFWRLSVYQPTMGFLTQINQLVLIGYGGALVIQGQLPLGAGLFVFANLIHEFANQVGQIINIANSIQASLTGAERIFDVLDADVEIESPIDAIRLPRARGQVTFEHVDFAYSSRSHIGTIHADEPVLQDISFVIEPGEIIGLVGETGVGKTTLLNLIARFYDVTAGRILIDGIDIRQLDLQDLRRNLGLVFQESFLFSNTVAANIAFGEPEADLQRVEDASRLAAAHEFVVDLPEGYDSLIGEHGCNLSGGQRQRLSIARALLLDPPILLLDDATAAVDPETEHEIQQAISSAQHGRTTILVSNRISALKRTDRIYVLHAGHIVESGSHEDLMRLDGEYAKLARIQFVEPVSAFSS